MLDAAMDALGTVILYTGLAGATVPLGGLAARALRLHDRALQRDTLHAVTAFGGGALLSAVALVLLPQGSLGMSVPVVLASFIGGAVVFLLVDRAIETRGGQYAQSMAMMMDAVPESLALGAAVAGGEGFGILLAILIGVQNFPEGFNAFRELHASGRSRARTMGILVSVTVATVLAGIVGLLVLAERAGALGILMVFASGGIVYLIFHDIAPEAHETGHWLPTLGAIAGFAVGLAGAVGLRVI